MSVKDVIEAISEAMKLAQRVESLGDKIADLSQLQREDAKELRAMMHDLDKRVVKIETLIEFTQRSAAGAPVPQLEIKKSGE